MAITYKISGVDIKRGNTLIQMIRPVVRSTFRQEVLADIGSFNALFKINTSKYKNPVLVSSTDGVGTKLKIAFMLKRHSTVGIDLVAMCVNDILTSGAEPLFFLDYFSTGKLSEKTAAEVIKGIAKGCKKSSCSLIGGETAEMPGMYARGEYDLAGFSVGIVERNRIINGSNIQKDDVVIGLASNGLHSNGYSLVRKLFFEMKHYKPGQLFVCVHIDRCCQLPHKIATRSLHLNSFQLLKALTHTRPKPGEKALLCKIVFQAIKIPLNTLADGYEQARLDKVCDLLTFLHSPSDYFHSLYIPLPSASLPIRAQCVNLECFNIKFANSSPS